ncbi:MAG: hypothetical protein CL583_13230 [Alteromonadaceae bacterium]|nr:hypothetical protein [Alteromonadaceae bacterium]|tara:strand:- start:448 stop:816 length:369 start_codon:yes stop_codon:yes gene_type:complete
MQRQAPPKREDCKDRAHWKAERIAFFKGLTPRDRTPPEPIVIEKVVKVVERVKETLHRDKPSAAFRAEMKPGETYEVTRGRLSQEYRDISDIVNITGGSAVQQARLNALHKLEFELRGGGGG